MRDVDTFLSASGYGKAAREPLAGDASSRLYVRLIGGPHPALLMDAPPPEDVRSFVRIAKHIQGVGLSAPKILAVDEEAGLLILEDFGTDTLASLPDKGMDPLPLYLEAVETLAELHEKQPPKDLPSWDAAAMSRATGATFLDWWWPAALGIAPSEDARALLETAIEKMLTPIGHVKGFVHRDYFPANLMRLQNRRGTQQIGVLDFQDAALGCPAYDVVSLVEDARRDVPDHIRKAAISRYLDLRPSVRRADFEALMAICAAQRHLRVAALWVRLERRDGKPGYLAHGPRCWEMLSRALEHPACKPLADFMDMYVPQVARANPVTAKAREAA